MSRLTASPFHKPSPYQFPRPVHPLSPPDTDSELGAPMQPASVAGSNSVMFGVDFVEQAPQLLPQQAESPAARFKRVSTLAYNKSGLREPQERSMPTSKSLVVIVPPESFSQEHGQLGHTLSSGPRNRLSHGILMPLFSTMYGQLMAIAKEFNFPSTVGICLYLHFAESGMTVTPRISDDTWQLLWDKHLHGPTPPPGPHGLPISGKIEFDIDSSKARWYTSWIAASLRETAEHVPRSRAPTLSHWRGDSKASSTADQMDDERQESTTVLQQTQTPKSSIRHVPRKLSLVDRFDSFSTASRAASRNTTSPVELEPRIIPALSPIVQADEPYTAKHDLEKRVNNWRVSASIAPSPLPPKDDATVEAAHVLLSQPLEDTAEDAASELNLDDFTWSVSSAGPPSWDSDSPLSSARLSSVHLDRRVQGSVYLSPPSGYQSPSVYLGDRGDISRPITPSTAITWETRSSYPPTPEAPSFAHTPDAGQLSFYPNGSVAIPNDTLPWTHVWPYHQNRFFDHDTQRSSYESNQSQCTSGYPYLSIYPGVYPHFDLYPAASAAEMERISSKCLPVKLQATYPVFDLYPVSYPHFDIYPTACLMTVAAVETPAVSRSQSLAQVITKLPVAYPNYSLYPLVYPANLDVIYPPLAVEPIHSTYSVKLVMQYPHFDIYPSVYPFITPYPIQAIPNANFISDHNAGSPPDIPPHQIPSSILVEVFYPVFNIYPAIYPTFDIYPRLVDLDVLSSLKDDKLASVSVPDPDIHPTFTVLQEQDILQMKSLSVHLDPVYPSFCLYPHMYPMIELYPSVHACDRVVQDMPNSGACSSENVLDDSPSVRISCSYPILCIYPPVYPYLDIYPSSFPAEVESTTRKCLPIKLLTTYPAFDLYPASYPHFDIYPNRSSTTATAVETLAVSRSQPLAPITVALLVTYPHFDLYPSVYPANLDLIYPSIAVEQGGPHAKSLSVHLDVLYPAFSLYPPMYPAIELYPFAYAQDELEWDVQSGRTPSSEQDSNSSSIQLDRSYPNLSIYSAVYPHFDIYPLTLVTIDSQAPSDPHGSGLPCFGVYDSESKQDEDLSTRLPARYPAFDLYPALYPNISLYPSTLIPQSLLSPSVNRTEVPTPSKVLKIDEMPPDANGYPNLSWNPVAGTSEPTGLRKSRTRSGTVSERVAVPTVAPVELPTAPRMSTSLFALPPSNPRCPPPPITGLPSSPAAARRSPSSQRVSLVDPKAGLSSSESMGIKQGRPLSPVDEHAPRRWSSMAPPPKPLRDSRTVIDRSRSLSSRPHAPRKRDSLVLQRAKTFESGIPSASRPKPIDESDQLNMHTLAQFPTPPMPMFDLVNGL